MAITLAAAAVCGYLDQFTQTFDLLEQKTYGERLEVVARRSSAVTEQVQQQIVLVTISDTSLRRAITAFSGAVSAALGSCQSDPRTDPRRRKSHRL